jgi:hypothetical protein
MFGRRQTVLTGWDDDDDDDDEHAPVFPETLHSADTSIQRLAFSSASDNEARRWWR